MFSGYYGHVHLRGKQLLCEASCLSAGLRMCVWSFVSIPIRAFMQWYLDNGINLLLYYYAEMSAFT